MERSKWVRDFVTGMLTSSNCHCLHALLESSCTPDKDLIPALLLTCIAGVAACMHVPDTSCVVLGLSRFLFWHEGMGDCLCLREILQFNRILQCPLSTFTHIVSQTRHGSIKIPCNIAIDSASWLDNAHAMICHM